MKMLVVDDQPAIRAAIVEIVRARGGEPIACADGASARAAIAAEPFPVVLLDLGLPDEDGIGVCRWLRTHPHGIASAVIGITGSLEPDVLQDLLDAGADDFLPKPFRADLLEIRIAIAERKAADNAVRLRAIAELAQSERERQDRELRDATERFRSLVLKSPELISVIGLDGSRRYISPSSEWLLGRSPDELIGVDGLGLLAEEDLEPVQAAFRAMIADPTTHPALTVRLLHRDGSYRTFEAVGTNMLDDPSVGGIVWVARDVTERNRALTAMRESEQRFRSSFDSAPIGMALVELDGRCIKANRALCDLSGYEPDELIGMRLEDLTHPDDEEIPSDEIAALVAGAIPSAVSERRYVRKDGAVRFILLSISAVRDENGFPSYFVAQMVDITARRRAEAALRRSEAANRRTERRFRSLIQNSSDIILVLDSRGVVQSVSPAIERVLGVPEDQIIGRDNLGLIHPADVWVVRRAFARSRRAAASPVELEARFRHRDGSWRWLNVLASSHLVDPDVAGIVVNARDITERKEAELQLAHALRMEQAANRQLTELNRAKSDFVSIVSHEFRTPLTSIQGFAELINEGDLDEAMTQEFAGLIHDEALRLGRLITEMLDLDRIESGQVPLSLSRVDLTPILEAAVGRLVPNAPAHCFDLEWQRPLPPVIADPDKMTQVFSNLLNNAVKYSPKGGSVTIGGGASDGRIELWVRDEGMGIPSELLGAIFDRFTRVEGGSHRPIQGTGLGLAIVRQIVAMHGGSVSVTSQVGRGSTFFVCLPIDGPTTNEPSPQPALASASLARSSNHL